MIISQFQYPSPSYPITPYSDEQLHKIGLYREALEGLKDVVPTL